MSLQNLINQRDAIIAQAEVIARGNKNNDKEKNEQVRSMFVDIDRIQESIDIEKRFDGFKQEQRSAGAPPRAQIGEGLDSTPERNELEKRAFKNYVTGRLTAEDKQYLNTETRDLTSGTAADVTGGGVLVPTGFDPLLHVARKQNGELMSAVRVWNTASGNSIRVSLADPTQMVFTEVPTQNTAVGEQDPILSGFASETATITSSLVKVSNELLQDEAFDLENFITSSIGAAYYRTLENAIVKGNLISTMQSIVTGAGVGYAMPSGGTSAITYNSLVQMFAALDPAYRIGSKWACNSATWAELMNITTTTAFPLLQPDSTGKPFSSIFGYDLILSQALPVPAAGNSPMLFGNYFEGFTVRQAGPLSVKRSTDRYFEENATAFVAFARVGAYNSVASTATPPIVKLVMAAS